MTKVPLSFNLNGEKSLTDLLTKSVVDGIVSVNWKEINAGIFFSDNKENEYWPKIESIKKHTPDFHFYNTFGFTVNKYSEFLIYAEEWEYAPFVCLKDSNDVEITIGEVTPLGYFIFDIFHDNNYHPELEMCFSIRVYGTNSSDVEIYLLNALNRLIYEHNVSFNFCSLESIDFNDVDDLDKVDIIEEKKLIINNELIPNRLFYKGLKELDSSNAFLDYYRVLEYYSIIILENDVDKSRNDPSVSKRDFVLKMNKIINDNERALLGKLIKRIADSKILTYCEINNLIDSRKPDLLSNTLYEFRNSLVHSKLNQNILPFSKSILSKDENMIKWNYVCKELAYNAMTKI